jgi:DnaK suppressor protein
MAKRTSAAKTRSAPGKTTAKKSALRTTSSPKAAAQPAKTSADQTAKRSAATPARLAVKPKSALSKTGPSKTGPNKTDLKKTGPITTKSVKLKAALIPPAGLAAVTIPTKKTADKRARVATAPQYLLRAQPSPNKGVDEPRDDYRRSGSQAGAEQPTARNGKTMGKKPLAGTQPTTLPPDYRPSESEPFMGALQRVYFRTKLQRWKDDIIAQNRETLQVLHDETLQHSDLADRANSETERALELRARDRQRKLVGKIDAAINLKRLDARPIATLSLEAQERHERREKVYRED